jgi:GPH family glycoside/pentoside/hexuronide:cation symporter
MAPLTHSARVAYGAPGLVLGLLGIPIYVHLPKYYGDALGMDLALIGAIILVSRAWDAVIDPFVGSFSDRLRTRWGRRRPMIAVGSAALALSTWLVLAPPRALGETAAAVWLSAGLFVMFTAWTVVQIPHAALGAEVTTDRHVRTELFAWRDGLWIVGTLLAAAAPSLVRAALGEPAAGGDERRVFSTLAAVYAPLLLALPLWCAWRITEPAPPAAPTGGRPASPLGSAREALRNPPFAILLVAYGIGALGSALPATLVLFYVEHVLRTPQWADAFLGLYFLTGFACLPAWTALARRVGRKRAWLGAMGLSVGAFSGATLLGPGDTWWFGLICVVSGTGFGAGLALPASLVADTVDYDEWRSGERREGLYFGLWSLVTKLSAAAGASVALPILGLAGYVAGGTQPDTVVTALRVLYAGVPCLCYAAAFVVAVRYPIDEERHLALRDALARRAQGATSPDPLGYGVTP